MFKTNVNKIISQFNKMIAELELLASDLEISNVELKSKIDSNTEELNKAVKVVNKLKEIVQ